MIKELWIAIQEGIDTRKNLSELRKLIKSDENSMALSYLIAGKEEILINLLNNADAKTRKNTALLMGDLCIQDFLEPLYEAYKSDTTLFVKSAYLNAIKNLDFRKHLTDMKQQLDMLVQTEVTVENEKHISEEIRELTALLVMAEGREKHKFVGYDLPHDLILLTNRNHNQLIMNQLLESQPDAQAKLFGAGVIAKVTNLNWIREIRTFQELLFTIPNMTKCTLEAKEAAKVIVDSQLLSYLSARHTGKTPYYFRIEYKSKEQLDKRSTFSKKLAQYIEKFSHRKLVNSTSDYEVEIRLIDNKEGGANILLRLFTIIDERFTYRKEVIPTSIKPVNAALTVALAKDYMKEDGQVLDPFCGVGTMLIERHKAVRANTTYGIDTQEEAIQKAKVNTEIAHQIIHYINRNFFQFSHEYLFDEIITNMPFKIGRKTEEELYEQYEDFFDKVKEVMKPDGVMILYSHNSEYVMTLAMAHNYKIIKEFEISKKEGTYVYVIGMI